jgi:formate dehydrogenase maturation protein FdhE
MCPPGADNRPSLPTVPICRLCGEKGRVHHVEVSGVHPGVHYWRCDACGSVWATRDEEARRAERSATSAERRTTDNDSALSAIDAVSARTRVLLNCSRAIRATVRSEYGATFTPRCVHCQQTGRTHHSPLTSEQHYICARCCARWTVQSAS